MFLICFGVLNPFFGGVFGVLVRAFCWLAPSRF